MVSLVTFVIGFIGSPAVSLTPVRCGYQRLVVLPATVPIPVHSPVVGLTVIFQLMLVIGLLLSPNFLRFQSTSKVVSVVVTTVDVP